MTANLPFVTEEEIRPQLQMGELIREMSDALAAFSEGHVVQPVRSVIGVTDHEGWFGTMPAWVRTTAGESLGVKVVGAYPRNADLDSPTHHAVILLFEAETGRPEAVFAGTLITQKRTAAVSAVATSRLARQSARSMAILGTGVQAASHLEALRLVRPIDEVRVWSPTREHMLAFAEKHGVRPCGTAEEAVRGVDIVTTVTHAKEPVLHGHWLKPGAHVNAVGACRPDCRELDEEAMRNSTVIVDSREAAAVEAGDVILNEATVAAEIGDVILGHHPGRSNTEEITVFKSLGLAVEDVMAAQSLWRRMHT